MECDLVVEECSVYYSFLRLRCRMRDERPPVAVSLVKLGEPERPDRQSVTVTRLVDAGTFMLVIEALIDRSAFPNDYTLSVVRRTGNAVFPLQDLVEQERQTYAKSMLAEFRTLMSEWQELNPGRRPQLIDIGGRARSGYRLTDSFEACDVTIVDIVADEGVDVVADIHDLGSFVAAGQFDFALCVSVFEHLLMPWKAVLEINKVMKTGGIIMIQTHQTTGMHDMPWDYYRYSDESWKGLFNTQTGFNIISTQMSSFQRIVPLHFYAVYEGFENAGGFNDSGVMARKIGNSRLTWSVDMTTIVEGTYPG